MIFFPYKADANIPGVPVVTIAIVLICIGVFIAQIRSERDYQLRMDEACSKLENKIVRRALAEFGGLDNETVGCRKFLQATDRNSRRGESVPEIVEKMMGAQPVRIKGKAEYLGSELGQLQRQFEISTRGGSLTDRLVYWPESWDPLRMLTASVSHGSWMHLIGNLVFFWAFAVSAEAMVGWWRFGLFCVAMGLGTHVVYSAVNLAEPGALATLGLSGVVCAVMALTAYFLPGAPIRTLVWLIRFWTILVPAWFLALWYIGFDAYQLLSKEDSSGINLIAHVSGGVLALLFGIVFFSGRKQRLHEKLDAEEKAAAEAAVRQTFSRTRIIKRPAA